MLVRSVQPITYSIFGVNPFAATRYTGMAYRRGHPDLVMGDFSNAGAGGLKLSMSQL